MNQDAIPFVRPTDSERNRCRVGIERHKYEQNLRDTVREQALQQATTTHRQQGARA